MRHSISLERRWAVADEVTPEEQCAWKLVKSLEALIAEWEPQLIPQAAAQLHVARPFYVPDCLPTVISLIDSPLFTRLSGAKNLLTSALAMPAFQAAVRKIEPLLDREAAAAEKAEAERTRLSAEYFKARAALDAHNEKVSVSKETTEAEQRATIALAALNQHIAANPTE